MSFLALNEEQFHNLRSRLDKHGYKHPFGFDSVPLIKSLLNDLLKVTNDFNKFRSESKTTQDADLHIEVYRRENAKLIKENNELHMKIIQNDEDSQQTIKDCRSKLRNIERENTDLMFLNSQLLQKSRKLEDVSHEKSEKIIELQNKNLQAVVQTPGGKNKIEVAFRRQRMEIDSLLKIGADVKSSSIERKPNVISLHQPSVRDPYIADMLKVADTRLKQLESELETVTDEHNELRQENERINKRVDSRDEEISRLQRVLSDGLPIGQNVTQSPPSNRIAENTNHLKLQLNYLQEKNQELEQSIEELMSEQQDALNKAKKDLDSNSMTENRRSKSPNRISSLVKEKNNLEIEAMNLIKQNEELLQLLQSKEKDIRRLESELRNCEAQTEEIRSNEKELITEIDRLNKMRESRKPVILEHRKNRVSSTSKGRQKSVAEKILDSAKNIDRDADDDERDVNTRVPASDTDVPSKISRDEKNYIQQRYEDDRDRRSRENSAMQDTQLLNRIEELVKEKVSLEATRGQDQQLITTLESKIEEIVTEKAKLLLDHQTVAEELDRIKSDLQNTEPSDNLSALSDEVSQLQNQLSTHKILVGSLENQVEEYELKLRVAEQEIEERETCIDNLRSKFDQSEKSMRTAEEALKTRSVQTVSNTQKLDFLEETNAALSSQLQRYNEKISTFSTRVSILDNEKDSLQTIIDDKTEKVNDLENRLILKEKDISNLKHTMVAMETQINQLNSTVLSKSESSKRFQMQSSEAKQELSAFKSKNESLDAINRRLRDDLSTMTKENLAVNKELQSSVDQQNLLKCQIQDYIVEIKRIEELLSLKERERNELLQQYHNLSCEADNLKTQAHEIQAEANTAKMDLFSEENDKRYLTDSIYRLEKDLETSECLKEQYESELSQMSYALAAAEGDNDVAQAEVDRLTTDLQIVKDLNKTLDRSKCETIEELQRTVSHLEIVRSDLKTSNQKVDALKADLQSKESIIVVLEDLLSSKRESEFKAEMSMEELSSELKTLQERLSQTEENLKHQHEELCAYRSKANRLDSDTEKLRRLLLNERFEREKVTQQMLQVKNNSPTSVNIRENELRDNESSIHPSMSNFLERVRKPRSPTPVPTNRIAKPNRVSPSLRDENRIANSNSTKVTNIDSLSVRLDSDSDLLKSRGAIPKTLNNGDRIPQGRGVISSDNLPQTSSVESGSKLDDSSIARSQAERGRQISKSSVISADIEKYEDDSPRWSRTRISEENVSVKGVTKSDSSTDSSSSNQLVRNGGLSLSYRPKESKRKSKVTKKKVNSPVRSATTTTL